MIIFRDQYLKSFGKRAYNRTHNWLGVIETWGELREEIIICDYSIKPFDKSRDYNDLEIPQRLIVDINIALTENDQTYDPYLYVKDICAILAITTGRLMRPSKSFGIKVDGETIIKGATRHSYRAHPNITVPILNNSLQNDINQLVSNLLNVRSENDIQKHLTLMRVLRLYNDSLCLLPIDEDAAYVLLVAAGEALAAEFSQIQPTFNDLDSSGKLINLIEEYQLDQKFTEKLSAILLKPRHLKLQAKFVDIIKTYLRSDFFDNPDKRYIPEGSYDQQSDQFNIKNWQPKDVEGFGKKIQLDKYLKSIYHNRSRFVHDGIEFPYSSKTSFGILAGIKIDKKGKPIKNSDGSYRTENSLPSYFWFERVMNNVIQNVIKRFGKEE